MNALRRFWNRTFNRADWDAAHEAYWVAQTPAEARTAYTRIVKLGGGGF